MINILKLFVASGIRFWHNEFDRATITLTFYYVLSTATILLVSSVAVLAIFEPPEIDSPFKPDFTLQTEIEHTDWSLYEAREHLIIVIFFVDVTILFLVSVGAYFFARKTLYPIKEIHEKQKLFMADVAHELRTPLAVMQTGADTILRRERTPTEYQTFVTDVQEESARLTRTANQLLQLLKIGDSEKPALRTVMLSDVLAGEVRRFTPYAIEQGITLIHDIARNIVIESNQDALIEIVQNLLKNAIDYSDAGDSVTVSLCSYATSVEIIVADTGVGLEKEQQKMIFNRFYKVNTARTHSKSSGIGLGLSIVSTLIKQLGGSIALQSTLHVGTTITVTLPKIHS